MALTAHPEPELWFGWYPSPHAKRKNNPISKQWLQVLEGSDNESSAGRTRQAPNLSSFALG
jgi:hypothetical protein